MSSKYPVPSLVIIPAKAAVVIPLPICSAEKPIVLKIRGLKYKTPPVPIDVHKRAFIISLREEGKLSQ